METFNQKSEESCQEYHACISISQILSIEIVSRGNMNGTALQGQQKDCFQDGLSMAYSAQREEKAAILSDQDREAQETSWCSHLRYTTNSGTQDIDSQEYLDLSTPFILRTSTNPHFYNTSGCRCSVMPDCVR
ncbi:hypothetical protein BGAL_0393g00090 [Botrytis galanthina]|uniref:Uncharacterized protein n=1 Tax=Botrytis galanthina TaxID=278940 RepID=A0A4V4HTP7_9HELO|nr:hypothetical protein BGAL_0393g00090 [Botrytis galanthina]